MIFGKTKKGRLTAALTKPRRVKLDYVLITECLLIQCTGW